MRPCKKSKNRKAGYLVLADRRRALPAPLESFLPEKSVLAKLARWDPKAREIGRALSWLVKRGAHEIFVIVASRLPKCAVGKDIPLAIEVFRKNKMHLDFHYCGSAYAPSARRRKSGG